MKIRHRRAITSIFVVTIGLLTLRTGYLVYREIQSVPAALAVNPNIRSSPIATGQYYTDFTNDKYFSQLEAGQFDRAGIPLYRANGRTYYHAIYISQFALGAFDNFLRTGDETSLAAFRRCAGWLKNSLVKRGRFFYWEYPFDIRMRPAARPVVDAMTQGEGVSVLVRAYGENHQAEYLQAAANAVEAIFYDLDDGGVSRIRGDFMLPQELPDVRSSDILNGAIWAYFGVHDYYLVSGDERAGRFDKAIATTLGNVISRYDCGYWSLYMLEPRTLADYHYHTTHVGQLRAMYGITGDRCFEEYASRFEAYQHSWKSRARYVLANHFRQVKELLRGDLNKSRALASWLRSGTS
jgi:heparosan-N-sulfate-glucuronate 5-epimerase